MKNYFLRPLFLICLFFSFHGFVNGGSSVPDREDHGVIALIDRSGTDVYDAGIAENEILTPFPGPAPRINGPKIYGVRPNKKFIYRIPCQGERPIDFEVSGLPDGLVLDRATGILTGVSPAEMGEYVMEITAKNGYGAVSRSFKVVVGEKTALTPPTGWNSWGGHMLMITDEIMRKVADLYVEKGLADVGFQYISLDDCWMKMSPDAYFDRPKGKVQQHEGFDFRGLVGEVRDKEGNIIPNKNFPDMNALTDYIHSFGLKAGLYSSPGYATCQRFAGSQYHEALDAKKYAEWGFDLLKYDLCMGRERLNEFKANGMTQADFWEPMAKFLKIQDRDIFYNLCQYGQEEPWNWAPGLGIQSWRIGGDLNHHVENYFEQALRIATDLREFSKPGQWNDPDFMYIHKLTDHRKMGAPTIEIPLNTNERYQYVTLWSIVTAPFFFSCNINEIDEFTLRLLGNADVLNINQDELGHVGEVIRDSNNEVVIVKNLADGSKAVAVFNRDSEKDATIELTWKEVGGRSELSVYDVWRQKTIGVMKDGMKVKLSADGVGYFILRE